MNKHLKERFERLMPQGRPRWIRCYDNGGVDVEGGTSDRYTVCFVGRAATEKHEGYPNHYPYRGMSSSPCSPQGIGMWGSNPNQPCDTINRKKPGWNWPPAIGRSCHLGKRIRFQDLPEECQKLIIEDYKDVWQLNDKEAA